LKDKSSYFGVEWSILFVSYNGCCVYGKILWLWFMIMNFTMY